MGKIQRAARKKAKLRMAIDGPSGSGKTLTALRFAFALGKKVLVIDSERGSAQLYAGDEYDGVKLDFDVVELESYSPTEYARWIEEGGHQGYDVVVVDSLSHAWEGKDGALELVDRSGSKNSYAAWKDVTPMHRAMIDAILMSPAHVIATMRSKTEYVLEADANGKQVPRKIGMAPVQRAGMEYEFTVYGSMDWSHILTITKSRCSALDGARAVKPGAGFMLPLVAWLDNGAVKEGDAPKRIMADDLLVREIVSITTELGTPLDKAKADLFRRYSVDEFVHLTQDQARETLARLQAQKKKAKLPVPAVPAAGPAPSATPTPAVSPAQATPPAEVSQPPAGETLTQALAEESGEAVPTAPALATKPQLDSLIDLKAEFFHRAGVGDPADIDRKWAGVLAKRGVKAAKDLTTEQADELIRSIKTNINTLAQKEGQDPPFREVLPMPF